MKSTLKAKLQHVYSKTHTMFALTLFVFFISWIPASQAACSLHDHFCSYHVGGATVTAGAAANTGTSLVMYATATNPGTTTASTVDFDTIGKMPANTGDRFLVGSPINYTTPTGPYIVNSTAYGTTHPPTTWSTPGDAVLQVAPSQYQLTFNQNTAIAKHTGDFNGGENGNIPGAIGCPNMPAGTKNCEAVVVTGNLPNGIYEQKVTLFNYFNAPNPQVQLQVGAYTTGRAVIISNSHESKEQAYFPILSGTGVTTPAYQYEVYNLGFDPHAKGTALFDQNKYSTRYSNTYEAGDHRFRDAYFTTLTTHNKVNADGWNDKTYTAKTSVEKQYMGEVVRPVAPLITATSIQAATKWIKENQDMLRAVMHPLQTANIYVGKKATAQLQLAQQRELLRSATETCEVPKISDIPSVLSQGYDTRSPWQKTKEAFSNADRESRVFNEPFVTRLNYRDAVAIPESMLRHPINTVVDFTPVVGDIKSFVEAETFGDYAFALAGVVPIAGDLANKAWKTTKTASIVDLLKAGENTNLKLIDGRAKIHILDGDGLTQGGHRYGVGNPGKTEFPQDWTDKKILEVITEIANDPKQKWSLPRPDNGFISTNALRDGVDVRVVYDPIAQRIETGYPINLTSNPKK